MPRSFHVHHNIVIFSRVCPDLLCRRPWTGPDEQIYIFFLDSREGSKSAVNAVVASNVDRLVQIHTVCNITGCAL